MCLIRDKRLDAIQYHGNDGQERKLNGDHDCLLLSWFLQDLKLAVQQHGWHEVFLALLDASKDAFLRPV